MFKLAWTIACSKSLIDQDNLITLVQSIEEITVGLNQERYAELKDKSLNLPIQLEVVSLWYRMNSDTEQTESYQLDFLNPKNELIKSNTIEITAQKGILRMRSRVKIDSLPINEDGYYSFVVKKDNKTVSTTPLRVVLKQE